MLHGQGITMDKAGLEERLAKAAPAFERSAPLIVGLFTVLTLVLAANLYVSPPTFQTELNDFPLNRSVHRSRPHSRPLSQ